MKYFVWVQDFTGPVAQIWYDLQVDGSGKHKPYLACHAISKDDKRSIEELKKDFAYEPAKQ